VNPSAASSVQSSSFSDVPAGKLAPTGGSHNPSAGSRNQTAGSFNPSARFSAVSATPFAQSSIFHLPSSSPFDASAASFGVAGWSNFATVKSFGPAVEPFGASAGSFFQRKPFFFDIFRGFVADEPKDALGLRGHVRALIRCDTSHRERQRPVAALHKPDIFSAPTGRRKRQEKAKKC
jgi:hypothetical protein